MNTLFLMLFEPVPYMYCTCLYTQFHREIYLVIITIIVCEDMNERTRFHFHLKVEKTVNEKYTDSSFMNYFRNFLGLIMI